MPIYTPALDLILNVGDRSATGRLALSGSQVVASPSARTAVHRIVRGDTGLARVRAVTPNLSGERAFDDFDLSSSTVRIALGIPGEDPYCLATLATPFPSAASPITAVQSATADLPATKRITLDPAPYAGTWLLTLDSLAPIELPWDVTADQIQALAGSAYSVAKRAANAWEISGTEPAQDLAISVDLSGLVVPSGLSDAIALNTVALAAAFTAAASGTPPAEPKWLRVTLEVEIDGVKVYQNDQVEIAREIINLSALVPTPLPPSDVATINTALAGKQPLNSQLSFLSSLTTTSFGRALLTKADGPAILAYLSAQPLNSQLSTLSLLVTAAYGRNLLTASDAPAAKTLLLLDQVDNTSDANKPVSTAQATADTAVANAAAAALASHAADTANPHAVTKAQVGLGNADNTSDANKPVSTAQATADTAVATTAATALASHAGNTANPHAVTKAQVGLGNADNTTDANKPVSTAQQAALDLKAALAGNNTFAGQNIFSLLQTFNAIASRSVVATQLANPGAPTVTPIGSDEGITRAYKISALLSDGTETAAGATGTTTHADATLDSTNKVSLAWTAVSGAASYNVYRLANSGVSPATIGKIANVSTNAYIDTGAAGDGTNPPIVNATGRVSGLIRDTGGQVYDVRTFGAMGDGVTNDSPAITALIASMPAGAILLFPAGSYYLATAIAIPKPLSIIGSGRDYEGTQFICANGVNGFEVAADTNSVVFENFRLQSYSLSLAIAGTIGIKANAPDLAHSIGYLKISDVEISGFDNAIDLRFVQASQVLNVRGLSNKIGLYTKRCVGTQVVGGFYTFNTQWGIFIDGDSGAVEQSCGTALTTITASGNGQDGGGNLKVAYNQSFMAANSTFDVPNSPSALNILISNVMEGTINGNWIGSCPTGYGVTLVQTIDFRVTNSDLIANAAGAIRLLSCSRCIISKNIMKQSGGSDVVIDHMDGSTDLGLGAGNVIEGNQVLSTTNSVSISESGAQSTVVRANEVAGTITLQAGSLGHRNRNIATGLFTGETTKKIAFAPAITVTSGSITSLAYAIGYYKIIDNEVMFEIDLAITTNGTAAGEIRATLPFTAASRRFVARGVEYNNTGKGVWGLVDAVGGYDKIRIKFSDGTGYPGGSGAGIALSGSFELP